MFSAVVPRFNLIFAGICVREGLTASSAEYAKSRFSEVISLFQCFVRGEDFPAAFPKDFPELGKSYVVNALLEMALIFRQERNFAQAREYVRMAINLDVNMVLSLGSEAEADAFKKGSLNSWAYAKAELCYSWAYQVEGVRKIALEKENNLSKKLWASLEEKPPAPADGPMRPTLSDVEDEETEIEIVDLVPLGADDGELGLPLSPRAVKAVLPEGAAPCFFTVPRRREVGFAGGGAAAAHSARL